MDNRNEQAPAIFSLKTWHLTRLFVSEARLTRRFLKYSPVETFPAIISNAVVAGFSHRLGRFVERALRRGAQSSPLELEQKEVTMLSHYVIIQTN